MLLLLYYCYNYYYYYLQCCVVDFIEKLNGESLNLSEEDFSAFMTGTAIPEGTNTVYMCDGLRLLHDNSEMVKKLQHRQEVCDNNVQELKSQLAEFRKEWVKLSI